MEHTIIQSRRKGSVVYCISENIIDNLSSPGWPGLPSEITIDDIISFHADLLKEANKNNNSHEFVAFYNKSGEQIGGYLYGTESSVDFSMSGRHQSFFMMYNHPNNTSFSMKDPVFL